MAFSINSLERISNKYLRLSFTDSSSIKSPNEIVFYDKSFVNDWSVITEPSQVPQEVNAYFVKIDTVNSSINQAVIRDIPFSVGLHIVFVLDNGVWYKTEFDLDAVELTSGFPGTINRYSTKQKAGVLNTNDIIGGRYIVDDVYDALYLPKESMGLIMELVIWNQPNNSIKSYTLNPNYNKEDIPYPLLDVPYDPEEPKDTDSRSFYKYWFLNYESKPELQPAAQVEYAPNYEEGIPPFYEGYVGAQKSDGYVFPAGVEWDEERTFTTNQWKALYDPKIHFWKRIKETKDGSWSRPIRIGAFDEGYLANRYIRRFAFPTILNNAGIEVSFKVFSFYKGEPNLIAEFTVDDTDYSFEDVPPERRTWEELTTEEKEKYVTYYNETYLNETGFVTLTVGSNIDTMANLTIDGQQVAVRTIVEKDNNTLWVVYAQKDNFRNLESSWTEPQLVPDGDGTVVRYNVAQTTGEDEINEIRKDIVALIDSQGGTEEDYYINYENVGWNEDYDFDTHKYIATREAKGQPWIVRKIRNESGVYEETVYKAYPINYYDRLTNTRTKFNFVPTGLNGLKNPEDNISGNPVDSPFVPKEGYELYASSSKKLFNNQGFVSTWSTWNLVSGRAPVVDTVQSSPNNFTSTEITVGNETIIERENTFVELEAKLFLNNKEIKEGDVYQEANAAEGIVEQTEEIKYSWKRLFNDGIAENLVIEDQFIFRIYVGFKNQTAFDNHLVTGNELSPVIPSSKNSNFYLDYKSQFAQGFDVKSLADVSQSLNRLSFSDNTTKEGYKRNGILYDATDSQIANDVWLTDDITKLADSSWADFTTYQFKGTIDQNGYMQWSYEGRASYVDQITYTENGVQSTVNAFEILEAGKILKIHHAAVGSKAVFEVTQWRKIVGNTDFIGVDEDYIPYTEEVTILDQKDRVKKSVAVLAENTAFLAKPNFITYTEDNFIGIKSILLSAFIENVPSGSWYAFDSANYNFDDAKKGINVFNGISFETVKKDKTTYWIDLADSSNSRNVLFSDMIKGDGSLFDYRVFKYHVDDGNLDIVDFATIHMNFAGETARDLKVSPEDFIISIDASGATFDGVTTKIFRGRSENVEQPFYKWTLYTKNDTVVNEIIGNDTNYPTNAQLEYILDVNTLPGATEQDRVNYVKANSPFRLELKDLRVNQANFVEDAYISYVEGGVGGLQGENGEAGLSVIYDKSDLVPSDNDGATAVVSENTEVKVFRGVEQQLGGVSSGQFNVQLVDARDINGTLLETASSLTQITGTELQVNVINNLNIEVTDLPDNLDRVNVRFHVREGTTILKDAGNNNVTFEYSLKKAKAGVPSFNLTLSAENQIVSQNDTEVIGSNTLNYNSNIYVKIGETVASFFKGAIQVTLYPDLNAASSRLNIRDNNGNLIGYQSSSSVNTQLGASHYIASLNTGATLAIVEVGTSKVKVYRRQNSLITSNIEFRISVPVIDTIGNPVLYKTYNLTGINVPKGLPVFFLRAYDGSNSIQPEDYFKDIIVKNFGELTKSFTTSFLVNGLSPSDVGAELGTNAIRLVKNNYLNQQSVISIQATITYKGSNYTTYLTVYNINRSQAIIPLFAGIKNGADPSSNAFLSLMSGVTINNGSYNIDYKSPNGNFGFDVLSNGSSIPYLREDISAISSYKISGGLYLTSNGVIKDINGSTFNLSYYVTHNLSKLTTAYDSNPYYQALAIPQPDGTYLITDFHKVRGEEGTQGNSFKPKEVYFKGTSSTPSKPYTEEIGSIANLAVNENSASGVWTVAVPKPSQGEIIWKATIEVFSEDAGTTWKWANNIWSDPKRLTGWSGFSIIEAYKSAATVADSDRLTDPTPPNWTLNYASLNASNTVYKIKKYVRDDGVGVPKFTQTGVYNESGSYFWSKPELVRKDGSNGATGRGIDDIKIENNNLKVRYTQSPFNTSYEDLGRVVGFNGQDGIADFNWFTTAGLLSRFNGTNAFIKAYKSGNLCIIEGELNITQDFSNGSGVYSITGAIALPARFNSNRITLGLTVGGYRDRYDGAISASNTRVEELIKNVYVDFNDGNRIKIRWSNPDLSSLVGFRFSISGFYITT